MSFEARKEWQRRLRRQERAVADTEQRIERLENEISEIESRLATPEGMADIDLCMRHGGLKKDLDVLMDLWTEQTALLEEIKQQENKNVSS